MAKTEELLKHISALEQEHTRLRQMLLGAFPETADNGMKQAGQISLDQMLFMACQRVASLVGDVATINGRIG